MDRRTKKTGPMSWPNCIWLKADNIETKTNPGPLFGSKLKANIIGNIAKPASIATSVSKDATVNEVGTTFWSLGIYAPYAMIEPIPRLKLKKAWPIALKNVSDVTFEKSGANKKFNALTKAPLNIAYVTINIKRNPSIGIKIFTIRPIPFLTPAETIKKVRSIKTVCQKIRFNGDSITAPNCSEELRISPEVAEIKI